MKRLHMMVEEIKASEQMGVTYMKMEERDRLLREEGEMRILTTQVCKKLGKGLEVQAFELGMEDYIMKPFDRKRLEKVLRRCMARPDADRTEAPTERAAVKRPAISSNGKTVFEDIKDIVYIETYNRGCLIHTAGNEYRENKSIGEYEKKLEDMGFFRIHKSYLINLDKVKEVFHIKGAN